jgi:arginyl-tRNA synthetase
MLGDLPPALITKSDGSTLYMTRDLAALKYRIDKYKPEKIIYHVGNDQALHFRQLEAVAEKLDWLNGYKIVFAGHGLLRLPEGKMSTRLGKTILLEDLMEESIARSLKIIEDKNPELKNKKEVAEKIGISAIKYSDLSQNRKSDIEFSFDRAISLEGNSGPYLQYTYARTSSLIKKYKNKFSESSSELEVDNNFREIAMLIIKVKETLKKSAVSSMPNLICDHAFRLANAFNSYYEKQRIVSEDRESSSAKIKTVYLVQKTLGQLLDILGVERLEEI